MNKKIRAGSKDRNSTLFNVPLVVDPSNKLHKVREIGVVRKYLVPRA
jgi:hypothetical protein